MAVLGVRQTLPDFAVPPGACDCHVHVFGLPDTFPLAADRLYTPPPALVDDLLALQSALSFDRAVIVQASPQGTDNACTLDALSQLGARARAIAVIADDVDDGTLETMDAKGVRGIRINLESHGVRDPVAAGARLRSAAARVAGLGWHVQVYAGASLLHALADLIATLPCRLVIDHFGRVRAADGTGTAEFKTLTALLGTGRVFVKLSAPHRVSDLTDYADVAPIVASLTASSPDQLLWGSDWPHAKVPPRETLDLSRTDPYRAEDDGANLNRLAAWVTDRDVLRRILVDNPAKLYGF